MPHGKINIYGLPVKLNCYSFDYQTTRLLYTGLPNQLINENLENIQDNQAILVMNDWNRFPTSQTLDLFALRLYEVERTIDVNIKNQKFPLIIKTNQKQKLSMQNLYNKLDGNEPFILADKNSFEDNEIQVLKTDSPYIADKLMLYKKQIWNEALTFLGINNILEDKKERLITDEANSNNELINLNLQSYLAPRKLACEQFNTLFGLSEDNKIDVRVRSDLHNIIKQAMSVVNDFDNIENIKDKIGGENNGLLYNENSRPN